MERKDRAEKCSGVTNKLDSPSESRTLDLARRGREILKALRHVNPEEGVKGGEVGRGQGAEGSKSNTGKGTT
ncbi:hypothetical protein Pmani_036298 [Petrolisthes manimaculis]|uniref:Uncharacterized protein n=1 Tax=Petrolisthes manimaculis TaxID=1843537 RepID=A0AAE1TPJ3_9EUCA|nr:hypothetical protein Pmani_036298 [Petrolisthes manimaculis]